MGDKVVNIKEQSAAVVEGMDELSAVQNVEYATIPGFVEGQTLRIASVTAGDMIEWNEANEGPAKRTAGLRLICKSLVNTAGVRYADDPKNIAVFRKYSFKSTEDVVKHILKLNGFDVKAGKEDPAKND